jgi:hypothetical protein
MNTIHSEYSPKIFLDLDGVVVDFILPAMELHGVPIRSLKEYPRDAGWDCVKACNMLRKAVGLPAISATKFWRPFGYQFYSDLPLRPGALEFVDTLSEHGRITIATSPTLDPQCVAGKVTWIKNNLPELARRFFITPIKAELGRPGSVLIDDNNENCANFIGAGGQSILVPRPWNDNWNIETHPYDYVIDQLVRMKMRGIL